jgi:transcriptional repressor NrdR
VFSGAAALLPRWATTSGRGRPANASGTGGRPLLATPGRNRNTGRPGYASAMRCPYCGAADDRVVDSRESREGAVIRRRRECAACERRFTSYETVEEIPVLVIKRDGRREPFDRNKLLRGLMKACEKRPVETKSLEQICDEIESAVHAREPREMSTEEVGTRVMDRLKDLDQVAYVRFASVYRRFEDLGDFVDELKTLLGRRPATRRK